MRSEGMRRLTGIGYQKFKDRSAKMAWFSAHIIIYTKFKDGIQDVFPVYENIVLIEADSSETAFEKAKVIGSGMKATRNLLTTTKIGLRH
jgi:Domain of unknown function (DUF4288)